MNTAEPYPAALPILLAHLESGGCPDRVAEGTARALAAAARPEHVDDMIALVRDQSADSTRIHLLRAIVLHGGDRAVEALRGDPLLGHEATALLSARTS